MQRGRPPCPGSCWGGGGGRKGCGGGCVCSIVVEIDRMHRFCLISGRTEIWQNRRIRSISATMENKQPATQAFLLPQLGEAPPKPPPVQEHATAPSLEEGAHLHEVRVLLGATAAKFMVNTASKQPHSAGSALTSRSSSPRLNRRHRGSEKKDLPAIYHHPSLFCKSG